MLKPRGGGIRANIGDAENVRLFAPMLLSHSLEMGSNMNKSL